MAIVFAVSWLAASYAGTFLTFETIDKFNGDPTEAVTWTVIGAWILVGLLVGYLSYKFAKYSIAILAGIGGAFLGILISHSFFIHSKYAFWSIVIGCALALFILALFTQTYIIMFVTALIGAYLAIRGLSFYTGGFPSETQL